MRRTQILAILLALLALCPLSTVRGAQPVRTADPGVNTATSDLTVVQQAYLKAAVSADGYFGQAVALSDDTAVVSAPAEGGLTGAVYVFIRSNAPNAIWQRQAVIRAPNPDGGDYFGWSVALDGDTLVVGAFGEDGNATGVNGDPMNNSVRDAGAAYVFVRTGTGVGATWTLQAYLKASNTDTDDWFGWAVAIAGDTIVVGAHAEDSRATTIDGGGSDNSALYAGAAYVFARTGTTWTQQAYLKATNAETEDFFGFAVTVAGDTVVVGAYGEDSNATTIDGDQGNNALSGAGAAYVFTRTTEQGTPVWRQQTYLKGSHLRIFDDFGFAVAINGDTIVIGAVSDGSVSTGDNGAGAAYVFVRNPAQGTPAWREQAYLTTTNRETGDQVGVAVAVAGDLLLVGALREASNATGVNGDQTNNDAPEAGAAYLFARVGASWTQRAYLKTSNTDAGDMFGEAVALSADTLLIGTKWERSNATGIDGDQQNNDILLAGAAYLFSIEQPVGQLLAICGNYAVYETNGVYHAAGWPGMLLVGTAGNDTLYGTAGRDLLVGLAGNDLLRGGAGDDLLCGGEGVDWLQGLGGNDELYGGPGNDVLNGGSGDYDQLHGDAGNDVLLDGDGVATITGGGGNDLLTVVLRNGWRDSGGQPRFTGLAAGYDNDLVTLMIRNAVRFWVALSGDEADELPSPLEGSQDFLTLIGAIDATSAIHKFEKRLLIAADADYLPPDEEAGAAYLSEPVGAKADDSTLVNRNFLPLIQR